MQIEEYFDFVSPTEIRIKGRRLTIDDVLYEYIHNAMSAAELAERFPTLTLEQIYATLLYYVRNQAEVDKYLAANLEQTNQLWQEQQANPTPDMLRLRQIRAQRDVQRLREMNTILEEQVAA